MEMTIAAPPFFMVPAGGIRPATATALEDKQKKQDSVEFGLGDDDGCERILLVFGFPPT